MVDIISRAEWGARYGDGRYRTDLPATEVWLHHSVSVAPDLVAPFDDDDAAIRHIEDIGRSRFGEVYGFPYTWGITPVGRIYQGHAVDKTGAHTRGHNTAGRAIVLVGNYQVSIPTAAQIDAAAGLLRHAHRKGWIATPRITGGHRDLAATACPGIYGYRRIPDINAQAAQEPQMTPHTVLYVHPRQGVPDALAALWRTLGAVSGVVLTADLDLVRQQNDAQRQVIAVGGPAASEMARLGGPWTDMAGRGAGTHVEGHRVMVRGADWQDTGMRLLDLL